jgi:hypothetical protein
MKKIFTCLVLVVQSIYGFAQTTSTFEDLSLSPSSYWNGSDGSGGFTDVNAYFENQYSGGYWEGFAYSNTTDVTTDDYSNQYSAYTGSGVGHSHNYAVSYGNSMIQLLNDAKTKPVTGFYVTNTTLTALTLKNGDAYGYTKAFGGPTGNDPDWFQLAITGYRNNAPITDTIKVKLADYTFADNSKDYILDTWRWVNLDSLGVVDSLIFILSSTDNGAYGMNTPAYFAMDHFNEPLYGSSVAKGSIQALFKDNTLFKSWASSCTVTRGLQNITVKSGPVATAGTDINGTDKADGSIVSLGDSGVAVLEFATPIKNGTGPDFAVFENSFDGKFLELAFVEVSSDGVNYVRFPAISKTNAYSQLDNSAQMDAALLYNLAGKYAANYGTPFDLEDIKDNSLLDVNNITHVKIIDVIGIIDLTLSSKDSLLNPVNDPFPTAFPSCGFDLDAVGVINQNDLATSVTKSSTPLLNIYPNPSANQFNISLLNQAYLGEQLNVFDANGILIVSKEVEAVNNIDASGWLNGIYYIRLGNTAQKIIKID